MRKGYFSLVALILPVALPAAGIQSPGTQTPVISTPDEIKTDALSVPCKNSERKAAVVALLEKMGAASPDVTVEKIDRVENLVVTIPGTGSGNPARGGNPAMGSNTATVGNTAMGGKIVVGAHYDKVENGCGAVDNWTGIVAMAHLYRSRRSIAPEKTFIFVAFGREEEGMLGSKAMVKSITKEEAKGYCEMINIDSLGMGAPQAADNMSNKKLMDLAAEKAEKMKMPFGHAQILGGDSDSSSFNEKGIPAITIHGLTNDWRRVLHTPNDQVAKVHPESVYLGYRLALAMIWDLDSKPCEVCR